VAGTACGTVRILAMMDCPAAGANIDGMGMKEAPIPGMAGVSCPC
jgi:hypothetical protein